ncbi:chaplin family protein [Coralliovum pocilloporae]|uniref:chaplin family protein n=1 Tax=Coralliovum pocilloporae TaxID=3066369 RepID=UPI00330781D7
MGSRILKAFCVKPDHDLRETQPGIATGNSIPSPLHVPINISLTRLNQVRKACLTGPGSMP